MSTVSVLLDSNIVGVTGVVNGVTYTFTQTDRNTWSADVGKSPNNIYQVDITARTSTGYLATMQSTLYAGLYLITDRTAVDVERYLMLKSKKFEDMTESEQLEWLSDLRGAYNYTDMNRVESAIEHIVGRLSSCYYFADIEP